MVENKPITDIVYLICDRRGFQKSVKNPPELRRGEVPIKVRIKINPGVFEPPYIEKEIEVNDWQSGIDVDDVEFKKTYITPEEAEIIRQKRLAKMSDILSREGYTVIAPNPEDEEDMKSASDDHGNNQS